MISPDFGLRDLALAILASRAPERIAPWFFEEPYPIPPPGVVPEFEEVFPNASESDKYYVRMWSLDPVYDLPLPRFEYATKWEKDRNQYLHATHAWKNVRTEWRNVRWPMAWAEAVLSGKIRNEVVPK